MLFDKKISAVYLGDIEVFPGNRVVDFLLVGGGGAGGNGSSYVRGAGGGGAGGLIYCQNYEIQKGEYDVIIGEGGTRATGLCGSGCVGGSSCFNSYIAQGGGGGGGYLKVGVDGVSGGGGGPNSCLGGCGISGCGNRGGKGACYAGGGGGGYSSVGGTPSSCGCGGKGGDGIELDISGVSEGYAGGGGGGGSLLRGCGGIGSAIYGGYGGGGQGANSCVCGCAGRGGVFILRYPIGKYDISGGRKYYCNGYTIHCFISSGTLTVN